MIAELLIQIKSRLAGVFPELPASLNGPATEADIGQAEKSIGRSLPEDLKQLYRLHNGETDSGGLFFGLPFLSIGDAMNEWTIWSEIADKEYASLDTNIVSIPAGKSKRTMPTSSISRLARMEAETISESTSIQAKRERRDR